MLLPVEDLLLNWPMLSYSLSTPYFPTLRIKWYSCYIPDDLCLGITNYKMVKIAKMNAAQSRGLLQHPVTLGTKMNSSVLAVRKEWDPIRTFKVDQLLSWMDCLFYSDLYTALPSLLKIWLVERRNAKHPLTKSTTRSRQLLWCNEGGPTYGSSLES